MSKAPLPGGAPITAADLDRMFPRALPAWRDAVVRLAPELATFYGFTRLDWVHFAGQIDAETDGLSLTSMRENMNFTTARRILEVYNYRLGVALKKDAGLRAQYGSRSALARAQVRNPEFLADVVYGGREGTPWMQGSRYIGRGPTQITHRDNYRAIGAEIQRQPNGSTVDLVANPEALATDPALGVRSAFADWHLKRLSRWARADDVERVSAVLNTGSPHKISLVNGMARRKRAVARAKAIWPASMAWSVENIREDEIVEIVDHEPAHIAQRPAVDQSSDGSTPVSPANITEDLVFDRVGAFAGSSGEAPEMRAGGAGEGSPHDAVMAIQRALTAQGYALGAIDGHFGLLTRRAVVAFQDEHGLTPDGVLDADDLDVLRATAPAELGDRATATHVRGSRQIAAGAVLQTTSATAGSAVAIETASHALFDVSPVESAGHVLAQAGDMIGKVSALGFRITPTMALVVIALLILPPLWLWGRKLITTRLDAHRRGLNLSR